MVVYVCGEFFLIAGELSMLTLWGSRARFCDGINRRGFLQVGALGGALTLADLFRAREAAGSSTPAAPTKSVIMVWLLGGPPQMDTYDMKPHAPSELRGEFQPIATSVPGIEISELFPKQARLMDKCAVLRSVVSGNSNHGDSEIFSGFTEPINDQARHPPIGAVYSKLRGPSNVPPSVSLRYMTFPTPAPYNLYELETGGLGPAHRPFIPSGPGMADLTMAPSLSLDRLAERRTLLRDFDRMRRDLDTNGSMLGMDAMTERAMRVVTSPALRDALDLSKEDPRLVERYGGNNLPLSYNGLKTYPYGQGTQLLIARRLVEAGVGFVSVASGYWDTHDNNFSQLRDTLCPLLDTSLSALIEDLYDRGLDKDVIVLVWGEFGRTARVNEKVGRDHWLPVMSTLISGGGLKTGQVIGSTDAHAEYPKDRPYRVPQVLSTVYRAIGIDPAMSFPNLRGRPMAILDDREPVTELL